MLLRKEAEAAFRPKQPLGRNSLWEHTDIRRKLKSCGEPVAQEPLGRNSLWEHEAARAASRVRTAKVLTGLHSVGQGSFNPRVIILQASS